LAEQVANRLVFAGHTELVKVTALLDHFNLLELLGEQLDELEAISLHEDELDEG